MSRPLLCRLGFHRWGHSYRDPKMTVLVRWRTECRRPRCRALLCYSLRPFR